MSLQVGAKVTGMAANADIEKAAALQRAGEFAGAEEICDAILAQSPCDFRALHLLGILKYQQGENDRAVELLTAASTQAPQSVEILSNLGLMLEKVKRFDAALEVLDRAIALQPKFADAFNNRGIVLHRLDRIDEALASFDRAIAMRSGHPDAWHNRGRMLRVLKRIDEALLSHARAIQLRPRFHEAIFSRAICLGDAGRHEEALAGFDCCLEAGGPKDNIQLNRGLTLARLGRDQESIQALDSALDAAGMSTRFVDDVPAPVESTTIVRSAPGVSGPSLAEGGEFIIEMRRLSQIKDLSDWRSLASRALEPNVFFEPAYLLAAHEIYRVDASVILVWSADVPRRLLALFPFQVEKEHPRLPYSFLRIWSAPHGAIDHPLLDREKGERAMEAILDHIANAKNLPKLVLFPTVPEEGLFAAILLRAANACGGKVAFYCRYQRALLALSKSGDSETAFSGQRRRKLRWLWKQLEQIGPVRTVETKESDGIGAAVDHYLAMEASGWKARAGTAATLRPGLEALTRAALLELSREGKARIYCTFVNDQPIAAALLLSSGCSGWLWKIAYDEAFARFSPGLLNLLHVTESLRSESQLVSVDSSTVPDHPLVNRLWNGRLTVGFCMVGIGSGAETDFEIAYRAESLAYRSPPFYNRHA